LSSAPDRVAACDNDENALKVSGMPSRSVRRLPEMRFVIAEKSLCIGSASLVGAVPNDRLICLSTSAVRVTASLENGIHTASLISLKHVHARPGLQFAFCLRSIISHRVPAPNSRHPVNANDSNQPQQNHV
jgi:hypothetical protein